MPDLLNRRILLKRRPRGLPTPDHYDTVEAPVSTLGEGQILVRNIYISLDPAIRGWMDAGGNYAEPITLGDVVRSIVLGRVIDSRDPNIKPGQIVGFTGGWEDYSVTSGTAIFSYVPSPTPHPLTNYLSVLGVGGVSAYVGLTQVGRPNATETVLVSGAAGSVGSLVCQFAKMADCRVVGIAGSDDKCAWLMEKVGCDAAINYRKTSDMNVELRKACLSGIDVYFDNVGGPLLEVVLSQINIGARIVMCGAIAGYNSVEPQPGPRNMWQFLVRRAHLQGFLLSDYWSTEFAPAQKAIEDMLAQDKLVFSEDIVQGLEQISTAFLKLFDGSNSGKLLVKISDE